MQKILISFDKSEKGLSKVWVADPPRPVEMLMISQKPQKGGKRFDTAEKAFSTLLRRLRDPFEAFARS